MGTEGRKGKGKGGDGKCEDMRRKETKMRSWNIPY